MRRAVVEAARLIKEEKEFAHSSYVPPLLATIQSDRSTLQDRSKRGSARKKAGAPREVSIA